MKEKNQHVYSSVRFKSKAPLKLDLLLSSLMSMFLGVLFLYTMYLSLIFYIRALESYTIWLEIGFIMLIMLGADIISYLISDYLTDAIIHYWGYLRNSRKHKNKAFRYTDYFFYTLFRSICLVFSLVWILSAYFYNKMPYPYYMYSFLWAWLIISFGCKMLSWGITNYIFPG